MKTSKKKKKSDIIDGGKDIIGSEPVTDDEVKIRITTWIDADILHSLKKEAEKRKIGYQTLLNQRLRSAVLNEEDPLQVRVEKLEKAMKRLSKNVG